MAAPARSVVLLEAEVRKPASHPLRMGKVAREMEEDDEKQEMCRRLFEGLMASHGPGRPYLYEVPKLCTHPCVLYTMKVSVRKAQASWSHRSSRRFFSERRGSFPIPLWRVVGRDGQVEPLVDRSGKPGEPDQPGIVSGFLEERYDLIELSRVRGGVIHNEGSPAPWREIAVIRGMPGGRGISVTSHVKHIVVRLHDILFSLGGRSATVDIRFSEHWFTLPAGWAEERVYAEDGFHIVDIAASVESLVRKLYAMRKQEDEEMERQKWETEEERERRLLQQEARRKQEEAERRKIRERNVEEMRRRLEEEAAKPPVHAPLPWDAALWSISEAHPAATRCYSKFKLSMNNSNEVSCKCVEQEGLRDMLWRVDNGEYVLPVSKTLLASASSRGLETLGFVEGYCDLDNSAFGPKIGLVMDTSGRTLSYVLMMSRSAAKVLTIKIFVRKLDILLDDGMVMSGRYGDMVDVHCDDVSSSELLKANWAYRILCKNIDGEGRTSFSTLLVHLKRKLQLQLTEEESGLYSLSRVDAEEDNEDLVEWRRKQQEWVPKPKHELEEVELHDCSLLFPTPWESEVSP